MILGKIMARGHEKAQSQQKAAEKAAKLKKQQGHSANDQKKAAQKALVHICTVCKAQMPDPKTYKQHFENKHPKNDLPQELKDIVNWWRETVRCGPSLTFSFPLFSPTVTNAIYCKIQLGTTKLFIRISNCISGGNFSSYSAIKFFSYQKMCNTLRYLFFNT
ncbi:hypothetical protein ABEB36_011440 [Hypothenemus hampei]|uniref:Small EDRK-rich factor-like N-terminal domain-containing protein n=1 Tax=Hypothenemus hampei TaxID=57062 RepID=A0ABD1EFF0_HYPHA